MTPASLENFRKPLAIEVERNAARVPGHPVSFSGEKRRTKRQYYLKPHTLLDFVKERLGLANDAALARRMNFQPAFISKVRNRLLPFSDELLLAVHEETDIPISTLKQYRKSANAKK